MYQEKKIDPKRSIFRNELMTSLQDPEKPETFVPGPATTVDDKPANGLFIVVLVDFFKRRMRMQQ